MLATTEQTTSILQVKQLPGLFTEKELTCKRFDDSDPENLGFHHATVYNESSLTLF